MYIFILSLFRAREIIFLQNYLTLKIMCCKKLRSSVIRFDLDLEKCIMDDTKI